VPTLRRFVMPRCFYLLFACLALVAPIGRGADFPESTGSQKARTYPYSMIGQLDFDSGRFGYTGSGTVVRPRSILTAGHNLNAYLSGRNLQSVEVMAYPEASAYDILWSDVVVVEEGALTGVMPEPLAEETEAEKAERAAKKPRRAPAAKPAAKAKAKKPKVEKPKAEKKPAAKAKTAKKTTAKKSANKAAKKAAPKKKGSK